jgi:uncharacterized cysteine cluster protein YcgN (CxxCxxCC family)
MSPSSSKATTVAFWRAKRPLSRLSRTEWESLCDGCGKCCLHKLEYEDDGEIAYTNVACKMLDLGSCRCMDYPNRARHVPDCITLTPGKVREFKWLPDSCAYRRLSLGKDLLWWHPLVSGDPESIHEAGVSVRGRAVAEQQAGPLQDHVVEWPNE